jgi:hypothetical protein
LIENLHIDLGSDQTSHNIILGLEVIPTDFEESNELMANNPENIQRRSSKR